MELSPIRLICQNCKREMDYPREADKSIPLSVTKIIQGYCDQCWNGDHDGETWYDSKGLEVLQY